GDIMTGSAHLGTNEHGLVKAFVLLGVDVLVRNLLTKDLASIRIDGLRRFIRGKRTKRLEYSDCMGRKTERPGSDAVPEIALALVRDMEHVLMRLVQDLGARLRHGRGIVFVAASFIVMKRSVASRGIGVADRAEDAAPPGVRVPVLRLQLGEGQSRSVVRRRIELRINPRDFEMSLRVDSYVAQRDVVNVVCRHVTARAEGIQQRSRPRYRVLPRADVEFRGALARLCEGIVAGPGCTVGRLRGVALAVGRGFASE